MTESGEKAFDKVITGRFRHSPYDNPGVSAVFEAAAWIIQPNFSESKVSCFFFWG